MGHPGFTHGQAKQENQDQSTLVAIDMQMRQALGPPRVDIFGGLICLHFSRRVPEASWTMPSRFNRRVGALLRKRVGRISLRDTVLTVSRAAIVASFELTGSERARLHSIGSRQRQVSISSAADTKCRFHHLLHNG